jgi:hypothetical protein
VRAHTIDSKKEKKRKQSERLYLERKRKLDNFNQCSENELVIFISFNDRMVSRTCILLIKGVCWRKRKYAKIYNNGQE